jgi:CheY-like chemotaxis protein
MTEPLRILVADDNEDAAEALGLLLGFHGHEVRLARDGREALDAACAWEPDAVLLDLEMPVMNGFVAAQAIREQTEVPVLVALSGWGGEEVEQGAKSAGFDLVFCKGVAFDELAEAVERNVAERHAHPPAGCRPAVPGALAGGRAVH